MKWIQQKGRRLQTRPSYFLGFGALRGSEFSCPAYSSWAPPLPTSICQPVPNALGTWAHTEPVTLGKELCFTLRKRQQSHPPYRVKASRSPARVILNPVSMPRLAARPQLGYSKFNLAGIGSVTAGHQVLSKYPPDQTPPTSNSRLLGKEEAPGTPWPWTSQVRVTKEWAES